MTYPQQHACPLTTPSTMRKGYLHTRAIRMTTLITVVTLHSSVASHTIEPSPVHRLQFVTEITVKEAGIDSHKFAMTKYWQTIAPVFTTDVKNVLVKRVIVLEKVQTMLVLQ